MFWIIRDTLSAGQGFGKYKVCGAAAYQILQYQQYQSGTQFNGAVMLHNLLVAFMKGCMCYQGGGFVRAGCRQASRGEFRKVR